MLLIDVDGSWPPAGTWMNRVTDHVGWIERTDGSVALGDPRPTRRTGRLAVGERANFAAADVELDPGVGRVLLLRRAAAGAFAEGTARSVP